MNVTPDEAQEMRCPQMVTFVRSITDGENEDLVSNYTYANCIGPKCMAWEWEENYEATETFEALGTNPTPTGDGWTLANKEYSRTKDKWIFRWHRLTHERGYCGFARRGEMV